MIAAATSDQSVHVYKLANHGLIRMSRGIELDKSNINTNSVIGARFANNDSNLLFVGESKGEISMHDLRQQSIVGKFKGKPQLQISFNQITKMINILCTQTAKMIEANR